MQSCLLYLGPEIGEKQDAVEEVRRTLQGKGSPDDIEKTSFYAGENSGAEMVAIMMNGSLLCNKRLFLIKNAENIKKKEDIEVLAEYMSDHQADPDTVLILLSEETSIAKQLENAVPASAKRIFWEMFENRKRDWVLSFFKRNDFVITEDGVDAILELVENNTAALRAECTRLCQFLNKEKLIDGAAAEKWLSRGREESSFTLFSRLAIGDLGKSLETMRSLLMSKEAPVAILAGLAWCFQRLWDYLFLLEENKASELELKKMGLGSPRARKDYENAARRYSTAQADLCVALTAEYDMLARSMGAGLESLLMDRYVYQLWSAALVSE